MRPSEEAKLAGRKKDREALEAAARSAKADLQKTKPRSAERERQWLRADKAREDLAVAKVYEQQAAAKVRAARAQQKRDAAAATVTKRKAELAKVKATPVAERRESKRQAARPPASKPAAKSRTARKPTAASPSTPVELAAAAANTSRIVGEQIEAQRRGDQAAVARLETEYRQAKAAEQKAAAAAEAEAVAWVYRNVNVVGDTGDPNVDQAGNLTVRLLARNLVHRRSEGETLADALRSRMGGDPLPPSQGPRPPPPGPPKRPPPPPPTQPPPARQEPPPGGRLLRATLAAGAVPVERPAPRAMPQVPPMEGMTPLGVAPPSRPEPAPTPAPPVTPIADVPKAQRTTARSIRNPKERYDFRWRVVDLSQPVTSNNTDFTINPDYPAELQPRTRDRASARLQVRKIAAAIIPDLYLDDTKQIDRGAPIVGPDLVVESGNGRMMALRLTKSEYPGQWEEYQQDLRKVLADYGLTEADLEGKANPVLVRERLSEVDRAQFGAEANQAATLQLSTAELGKQDARNLPSAAVADIHIGENQKLFDALKSAANADLVRAYLQTIPENERAALRDEHGRLNVDGLDRLSTALFAKVYRGEPGDRLLRLFHESTDDEIKNLENAMRESLPEMAKAEGLIERGDRAPELSLSSDIAKVVDKYKEIKRLPQYKSVQEYLDQSNFLDDPLTPNQIQLLRYFEESKTSSKRLREFLKGYAGRVLTAPPPAQSGFFGATAVTKERLVNQLIHSGRATKEFGTPPGLGQDPLFAVNDLSLQSPTVRDPMFRPRRGRP